MPTKTPAISAAGFHTAPKKIPSTKNSAAILGVKTVVAACPAAKTSVMLTNVPLRWRHAQAFFLATACYEIGDMLAKPDKRPPTVAAQSGLAGEIFRPWSRALDRAKETTARASRTRAQDTVLTRYDLPQPGPSLQLPEGWGRPLGHLAALAAGLFFGQRCGLGAAGRKRVRKPHSRRLPECRSMVLMEAGSCGCCTGRAACRAAGAGRLDSTSIALAIALGGDARPTPRLT